MNTNQSTFHIGVDVGKHQLDCFCHESGDYFQVANTPEGIRKALKQLKPLSISRLVVEATGRHEQALVVAATRLKIPVVIAQPIAVRRFAGALWILAKTDKLDSRVIAQYAAYVRKICLGATIAIVVTGFLVGLLVFGLLTRRLSVLTRSVQRFTTSGFDPDFKLEAGPSGSHGGDEIGQLSAAAG